MPTWPCQDEPPLAIKQAIRDIVTCEKAEQRQIDDNHTLGLQLAGYTHEAIAQQKVQQREPKARAREAKKAQLAQKKAAAADAKAISVKYKKELDKLIATKAKASADSPRTMERPRAGGMRSLPRSSSTCFVR